MPDDVRERVERAMAHYLTICKATPKIGEEIHQLYKMDAEEALLIAALAQVWQEWKGVSPRTRNVGAEEGRYPFGQWLRSLFDDADVTPPALDAIRRTLSRGKRQRKVWSLSP